MPIIMVGCIYRFYSNVTIYCVQTAAVFHLHEKEGLRIYLQNSHSVKWKQKVLAWKVLFCQV